MSATIDERVVEMRFDNAHFEKNVNTSMSTLDKLKQKLNLTGASKGLENLDKTAKNINFSGISKGLEKASVTMSKWEYASLQSFSNIISAAERAGNRIIKAITIDPVKTGFQEYETQINAVQTILANTQSKGTTIDDVNAALDELNTYADKTIYNFTEMTRNIGTFTAAGIELEPAVNSIQGIANLAAVSGSNAQQASTAMYQLSQALAAGSLKLQDWNSVVNAGMGGQVFQDALKRTAKAMGIGVDEIIEKAGSFRESLSEGWITSDVLTETLNQLAGVYSEADLLTKGFTKSQAKEILELATTAEDAATKVKTFTQLFDTVAESIQSGWTTSWELLIGDFNEAKELLTGISDGIGSVIEKMNTKRNAKLEKALTSPWEKLIKEVNAAGISTTDFEKSIIKTAKKHGVKIDQMIKKEGSFSNTLSNGWLTKEMVIETMNGYTNSLDKASDATGKAGTKLEQFDKIVKRVINGDFGNGADRVKKLTDAGYDYSQIQDLVNKTLSGQKINYDKLSDAQLKNMGYTSEQIKMIRQLAADAEAAGTPLNELIEDMSKPSGRDLLIDSFKNVIEYLANGPLKAAKKVWDDIVPKDDGSGLYDLIEKFHALTEALTFTEEQGESLKNVFRGVLDLFDLTHTVLSWSVLGGLKIFNEVLKLFGTNLGSVIEELAIGISKFREWVEANTIWINWRDKVAAMIHATLLGLSDCIKAFLDLEIVTDTINKIKNAFVRMFKKVFGVKLNFNVDGVEAAKQAITDFFDVLEDKIDKLKTSEMFKSGLDIVSGLILGITSGIDKVVDTMVNLAKKLIEAFTSKDGIDSHSPSKVFIAIGGFIIAGLLEGLIGGSDQLKETALSLANTVVNAFDDIIQKGLPYIINLVKMFGGKFAEAVQDTDFDLGSFAVFASLIATFLLVKKAMDIAEGFSKPFAKMGDMLGSLSGMFKSFGEGFKSLTKTAKIWAYAEALKSMAVAIAILAASLVVLSKIETGPLLISLGALAAVAGILIALLAFTKKMEPEGFVKLSVLMVSLGASILLMAASVKMLASIDSKGADNAIGGLIVMFGGFIALIAVYGKLVKGKGAANMSKAGFMVMEMAVGMFIVAKALEKLCEVSSDENIGKALALMIAIEAIFAAFVVIVGNHGKRAKEVSTLLSKLSIAIAILALTIKIIADIGWGDVAKGLTIMGGAGLLFAAVVKASHLAGKNARKAGSMLLQMSVAIGVLALTIKLIASIPLGDILKGGAVIGAALAMFSLFIGASFYAGKNAAKAGAMLLGMGTAMLLLSFTIKIIAGLSLGDVIKGLAVITAIGLLFKALIEITAKAGPNAAKAGAMLISMAGAMLLLSISMALISMLKPEDVLVATVAMSAIMGMFALIIKSTAVVQDCMKTLLVLVAAFGAMAIAIALLSSLDQGRIAGATACLVAVMGMFAVMIGISKFAATAPMALVTIGVLTLVVAAFAVILYKLSGLPIENTLGVAASLSILLLSLSASCLIMSTLAGVAPAAFAGVVIFGALVAELAVVLSAVGTLYKNEGLRDLVADGGNFLQLIGTALGQFVGGIVGGIAKGITSALPQIGTDLSNFMTNATPFIEGAKTIDSTMLDGVTTLTKMILMLTAANLLESIASFITGGSSLASFAEELVPFGEGMKQYSDSIVGIDSEAIENSAKAAKAMAKVADAIPNSGGLAGLFAGNNDIDDFGKKLVPFGKSMKSYSDAVAGINVANVENASTAAKSIAKAIKKVAGVDSRDARGFKKAIKDLGECGVQGFIDAFNVSPTELETIGANLSANVVSGVDSKKTAMETAGSNIVYAFGKGVQSRTVISAVKGTVKTLLSELYNIMDGYEDNFYRVGRYLVQGFADGISSNIWLAEAKATAMARAAEQAAKRQLDEHSPSKVGYEIGDFFGIAFVNGISDNIRGAYKASDTLATSARTGMSEAIGKIGRLLEGDMDFNPTIRPILDLDNVRTGSRAISSMLGFGSSIGVMNNIGAINTSMRRRNQNGGNSDVVSAIDKLRNKLDNVGNTSYVVNGVTYDDGSSISEAVNDLINGIIVGGRV